MNDPMGANGACLIQSFIRLHLLGVFPALIINHQNVVYKSELFPLEELLFKIKHSPWILGIVTSLLTSLQVLQPSEKHDRN